MKKTKISAVILSALVLLIFTACHTETPLGIDREAPEVELLKIYSDSEIYFDSSDTLLTFTDFSITLKEETGSVSFEYSAKDNSEIHDAFLIAEDKYTREQYELKKQSGLASGTAIIVIDYSDIPIVQDTEIQEFYFFIKVSDTTENSSNSKKMGFNSTKELPFTAMYNELGLIQEIEGDSIDFREKNGKLAFVQFMYKGCLSCVEEARDVKEMYEDPTYDRDTYSHSMFGRSFGSEKEFLDFKVRTEKLPFDCFLDQPENKAKTFFEKLTGEIIETAFFAVMPNGKIIKYKYEIDFPDWLAMMYSQASQNN